jgi:hypothetical protein
LNFKYLKADSMLKPDQVESAVKKIEDQATHLLSPAPEVSIGRGEEFWSWFKTTKAGQYVPFDTLKETMETFRDMAEDGSLNWHFSRPEDPGVGVQIPILIHTFLLERNSVTADGRATHHLQWSCASDIGWDEEAIDRWWDGMFLNPECEERSLYTFPAMHRAGERFLKLFLADTPEGQAMRNRISPYFTELLFSDKDEDKAVTGPHEKQSAVAKKHQDWDSFDLGDFIGSFDDMFSVLSEFSPGFGELLATRLKAGLRESLGDIEDVDF